MQASVILVALYTLSQSNENDKGRTAAPFNAKFFKTRIGAPMCDINERCTHITFSWVTSA